MATKMTNQEIVGYFDKWGKAYSNAWESVARRRLSEFETDLVHRAIELALKSCGG